MRRPAIVLALWGLAGGFAVAAPAEEPSRFTPLVEARVRYEWFDTPLADASKDAAYDFGVGRIRAGGDFRLGAGWTLHGLVQAAGTSALPTNAGFGNGSTLFATNGGDRTPEQVGVAELAFVWRHERFTLGLGRQAWVEGAGPATGIAHLDFVRTRRIGERLVGTLEFANIGRRFDGLTFVTKGGTAGTFELFALRALGGASNYEQAFEELDVDLYGVAWTTPHDAWIPGTSLRLFVQGYRDERDVAQSTFGGDVDIATFGGSVLTGGERWSALLWLSGQEGDLGAEDQSAWAAVVDLGHRFAGVRGEPSVHLAWERASGGARRGEGFHNLLPTNHKFYGALDYFAFSNLTDLFVEGRWTATQRLQLSAALHDFRLSDRRGEWVTGAGAFSDREVGYTFRRPSSGRYESSELGRELDFTATWSLAHGFIFKGEGGIFWGGDAAREVFPDGQDGSWVSLELAWKL